MEIWRTGICCISHKRLHVSNSAQCHAYNTWAFIQDGRLLTKTGLLPWAFKRDGRLIEEGV